VPGVEVAVDGILTAGNLEVLAVFDKPDTPQGPTFPETLLVSPARLDPDSLARVVDVAGRACAAVGLVEGPVHVECKVEGSQVWFIELAPRTIGGMCSRAVESGGNSLEEVVIHHALGLPDPRRGRRRGATGVLMLPVAITGRLDAIRGVAAARAVAGVVDVIITAGPGQEVVALPEGDRYLGFVLARADGPDEVEAALRQAWATLEVEITAS
jgi:formate-dependent phosphoribosylglycinamide formyltransferase (GAR transformylase)